MTLNHIRVATRQLQEAEITIDEFMELVEAFIHQEDQAKRQELLDIPELQSEWEEDIHGNKSGNGIIRNELRTQIVEAINKVYIGE